MRKELDEKLCEKYPLIFSQRHAPMTETAMCWGFDCGDGWYDLIDVLCHQIQSHIDWRNGEHARWTDYNERLDRAINGDMTGLIEYYDWAKPEKKLAMANDAVAAKRYHKVYDKVPQVVAVQVKEKFGGLRFYVNGGDDAVDSFISFAESMSHRICEKCGKPGKSRTGGWIYTLCDEHAEEKQ